MNKPFTVKQLYKECKKQIDAGNGDKVIMLSQDDEGNGYHYLWYSFTRIADFEKPFEMGGKKYQFDFEYADERVAKKEDTIVLG